MAETSGAPDPGIAVLVMTDGREEYLRPCLLSAAHSLTGVTEWWMHDDSGDDTYRDGLRARHPSFRHIGDGARRGFGGAIQHAWRLLRISTRARFIFHLEADFTFRRPVDLAAMAAVLDTQPHLAQMALQRQPWSSDEHVAGGVVQRFPDAYEQRVDGAGRRWLEHRLFWTTNPALFRHTLLGLDWPYGDESEGRFGMRLLQYGIPGVDAADVRFGYWGAHDAGPCVDHIGHTRAGNGY